MPKHALITKHGTAGILQVLGADVRFLCESEHTGRAWSLMEVELPLHAGPPPHEHDWDEAYYVLASEVRFSIGSETHLLSAGDFLYAPGNVVHGFAGASSTPARVLIFDAPGHAGAFFKEVDQRVRRMPEDLPLVPSIGDRHGIRFQAPRHAEAA